MVIVHSTGRRSAAHLLADHEKPVALYLLESNLRRVLPFDRAPRDALRLFREVRCANCSELAISVTALRPWGARPGDRRGRRIGGSQAIATLYDAWTGRPREVRRCGARHRLALRYPWFRDRYLEEAARGAV